MKTARTRFLPDYNGGAVGGTVGVGPSRLQLNQARKKKRRKSREESEENCNRNLKKARMILLALFLGNI